MSNRHRPTVGGRMRGFALPYLVALTVLWVLLLSAADLLPKEGEMIPRGGAWRPATDADRVGSFLWLTGCWYFGAAVAFGLVWRLAQIGYDLVFDGERR